jgi:hypothetical protein
VLHTKADSGSVLHTKAGTYLECSEAPVGVLLFGEMTGMYTK